MTSDHDKSRETGSEIPQSESSVVSSNPFSTITDVRVRYADTDQMKTVYYAKYFDYFEQARSDLLREMGMPYPEIERMGYYLPVVEAYAKYFRPARYDDLLSVKTILRQMPQVRVRIEYEIHRGNDAIAEGYTVHSFVSTATGRPARAPERFLQIVHQMFADRM